MFFTVIRGIQRLAPNPRNCAVLYPDGWDDWFEFKTMFALHIFDAHGAVHQIGSVKIGQHGLRPSGVTEPGQRSPEIPDQFDALDARFFSLSEREDYYLSLNSLDIDLRNRVLVGLRDCAFNLEIFDAAQAERSMVRSLLRDVDPRNVRGRLHRITLGDVELTQFRFAYTLPSPENIPPAIIDFAVIPDSQPPTNVHVLIGRNGVGKTQCMRQLAEALLGRTSEDGRAIGTVQLIADVDDWSFAGLVLVSFSAFDDFDLQRRPTDTMGSQQVGLRHQTDPRDPSVVGIKAPADLANDFTKSFEKCRVGLRADGWRAAIETLETDDLFGEANVTELLQISEAELADKSITLFRRLSSGHAIVLLTITRLVELVDEKTFVLLDEPEGHLHPPLLSAFIRCLSDLLVKRNGVALIATHSPVVLQEVPRSCAWKLRRSGGVSRVDRPTVETFGENIGVLTREVFGLEVTRAGFHNLLRQAVSHGLTYAQTNDRFNGQLGAEAQAIVQALVAERDNIEDLL